MAVISILPNGTTSGNPNIMGNKNPPLRSETIGWNYQVSARLKKWLYSIPVDSLDGQGLAFTLTVKDCPEHSEDWAKLRDQFLKRMMRKDCIRIQWLTEWQRRGVPHLHGIAYFSIPMNPDKLVRDWLDLSNKYGSGKPAQDCKPITSVLGWLDYLCKHAARSAVHYQRSPENVPAGWNKTGRMWGYRGDWVKMESIQFEIDQEGFNKYRRIAKALHHSKVRQRLNKAVQSTIKSIPYMTVPVCLKQYIRLSNKSLFREFRSSRKSLQTSDVNMGRMMGTSDWIDQEQSLRIIAWLGSQGSQIHQRYAP